MFFSNKLLHSKLGHWQTEFICLYIFYHWIKNILTSHLFIIHLKVSKMNDTEDF